MADEKIMVRPAVEYADEALRECLDIAEEIADEAARLAPVETGELRAGYQAVPDGEGGASVVNPVPYLQYVEFGTSEMHAEPHLRPAIEIVRARHSE